MRARTAILPFVFVLFLTSLTTGQQRTSQERNIGLLDGSQLIQLPTPQNGDVTGADLVVLGDILVTGSPSMDDGSPQGDTGRADVFKWNPDFEEWEHQTSLGSLLPAFEINSDFEFGYSVDMHGDTIIVGAPGATNSSGVSTGRAYLFRRFLSGENDAWEHVDTLDHGSGIANSRFGENVALNDSYAFVCALNDVNSSGGNGQVWSIGITRSNSGPRLVPVPDTGRNTILNNWGVGLDYQDAVLGIGGPTSENDGMTTGAAVAYPCVNDTPQPRQLIIPPESWRSNSGNFGQSITYSSGRLMIGVPNIGAIQGAVLSYGEDKITGEWQFNEAIVDADDALITLFGWSVAMYGDLMVVGAPYGGLSVSGHATVFRYSPTAGEWVLENVLNPEIAAVADWSGRSVGVCELGVMVASPFLDVGSFDAMEVGGVFFYQKTDGQWQSDIRETLPIRLANTKVEKPEWLEPSTPSFGYAIASADGFTIVGDDRGDGSGEVHVYYRDKSDVWTPVESHGVVNPTLQDGSRFGLSIAMDANVAVVGSPQLNNSGGGAASVFERDGANWSLIDELTIGSSSGLGMSVATAVLGDLALIAAGDPDGGTDGLVYIWRINLETGNRTLEGTLQDPSIMGEDVKFGFSLDMDVDASGSVVIAIGNTDWTSNQLTGSVELFRRDNGSGTWSHEETVQPGIQFPDNWSSYAFGYDVAIDDGMLVVGAPQANWYSNFGYFAQTAGDAYLFKATPSSGSASWTLDSYLNTPTGRGGDIFGFSVGITAEHQQVFVGAPYADYMGRNTGLVAVYEFNPDAPWNELDWEVSRLLLSNDYQEDDDLGLDMAVAGDRLMVTAPAYEPSESILDRSYIADFEIENVLTWTSTQYYWPPLSDDSAWSRTPEGSNKAVFSRLLAPSHPIYFDVETWNGSMEISLEQLWFDFEDSDFTGTTDATITGNLEVSSPPEIRSAALAISSGELEVQNDVTIGRPGESGSLELMTMGISIGGNFTVDGGSSLRIDIDDSFPASNSSCIETMQPPSIGGSVSVDLSQNHEESLSVGDEIVLLRSNGIPVDGQDRFDLVLLPALPNDLAFQIDYRSIENARGGGETWEVVIEVVNIADLLDFADANTTTVDGDAVAIEVVDLNNDGADEICVVFDGSPGQLVIFENDGAGGIDQQIILNTGDEPVDITSGDFDDDGNQDLAVANRLSQDVIYYVNEDADPSNGFTTDTLSVGQVPTCLAAFDYLSADSLDDLVVGFEINSSLDGGFEIFAASSTLRGVGFTNVQTLGMNSAPINVDPSEDEKDKDIPFAGSRRDGRAVSARGSFARGPGLSLDEYPAGADLGGIVIGDINNDGFADMVLTSRTNNSIPILIQDSANPGEFLPALQVPAGLNPSGITIIDFDSDGNNDIATITTNEVSSDRIVRVLQNDGNLTFTSIDLAEGEFPLLVDSGDVNGDGTNDLVTIGDSGSLLRNGDASPVLALRKGETSCDCSGDVDCNGSIDIDDLLAVLSDFDCAGECSADLNGDSTVDVEDLLIVIAGWNDCR